MNMYRVILGVIVLAAMSIWVGDLPAQEHSHEQHAEEQLKATESQASSGTDLKVMEGSTCPVMGGTINKKYSHVYKGTIYYFCCSGCVEQFKADPDKYVEKMPGK